MWGGALVPHPVTFGDPVAGDLYTQTDFLDALAALGIPGGDFSFKPFDLVYYYAQNLRGTRRL
jgi:hypothetical protein